MILSWSDFRNIDQAKFDKIVDSLAKKRKVSRAQAIDILDEEYVFEQLSFDKLLASHESDGSYTILTLSHKAC